MELEMNERFCEISADEMQAIDGGSPISDAVAVLTYWGACIVTGFNAGRQFVRDLRDSFSDTGAEPIIVVGEPI